MNNILDDVKKNLRWIVCAFLGLFHFVLLAMPFITAYAKYSGDSETQSQSGYKTLSFEIMEELDAGVLVSLLQILLLIVAIVLLLLGAYVLVKAFLGDMISSKANFELPESFGPLKVKGLCNITYLVYAAVNVLLFLSGVLVSLMNSDSFMGVKIGLYPSVGSYLMLILSVGSFVALTIVEMKHPELLSTDTRKFACGNCGAPAKSGTAFCQVCGGQVTEVAPAPKLVYFCENCNTAAKQGTAFCSACGGRIVAAPKPAYACENCNTPAKEGVAFCSKCGGRIIRK